jgi:replication factor A1
MAVKDIAPNMAFEEVTVEVVSVEPERQFDKFGKTGRVANAVIKDETGEIKLVLWNEQIDQIKPGMKVKILKGYCKEWNGELQISTGKFGSFEILQ